MTFAELKTELSDRGFSSLSDTRLGRYVNAARAEMDDAFLWPYLENSVTGVAPMYVSDLGVIEAVVNLSQNDTPLDSGDYRTLLSRYGDLSVAGTPHTFYVAWPTNEPVVATYPTSGDTIGVQYYQVAPDLTGIDEPLAPARFHSLVVDIAVRMAYRDTDAHQKAESLQIEIDRRMGVMVNALLGGQQIAGPQGEMGMFNAVDA